MKTVREYRWYIIFALVPALLGSVFCFVLTPYRFMGMCLFAVSLVSLVYLGLRLLSKKNPGLSKTLNRIFSYVLILFLMALAVTEACIVSDARAQSQADAQYAVVLGAGVNGYEPSRSLQARLEAAMEYSQEHPDTMFILSGGQGGGERISEAECMRRWLEERGLEPDRIIMEDRASSTLENITFSRDIILEREPNFDGTVCIITEGYHVLRARLMAMDNGLENVTAVGGSTGLPLLTANYYLREAFGIWYYMLTR